MTARRIFTAKEIREAVTLVQAKHVGIRFWPDGSMEIIQCPEPVITPPPTKPKTYNYFVRCEHSGLIKIGYSANPYARLVKLKSDHAFPLTLIHIQHGDRGDERVLHRRFKHLRYEGEWFRCEAELAKFLEGLECNLDL